jgi:hypothetical protein
MIVYTSPSVPPLEGKGWLRTKNAPADKKHKPCPGLLKRRKIDGVLRFSVLHPLHIGRGLGEGGCFFASFFAPKKVRKTRRA